MNWFLKIAPAWVWATVLLLLLVVLILVGLYLLLRRSQVKPDEEGAAPRALDGDVHQQRLQWLRLRRSFVRTLRSLRDHVAGRGYRYGVPWLALVGVEASGKSTVLEHTGMLRSWHSSPDAWSSQGELGWGFFDHGILIDVPGSFLLRKDGMSADDRGWHGLLRLLQRHRARRPLDGFVLTLACSDLLDTSLSASAAIHHKATVLFEKLWEAERVLGMRLPVYVLVTQCDRIPGFQSFAQSLPEARQRDLFGWSNPYHLDTAFSATWVDEAFLSMQEELQRVQGEIFVAPKQVADPDQLFLFPGAFWRLREPLRIYLGRIFKETGYRESFFFRGLYFCGDLAGAESPAAQTGSLPPAVWTPEPLPAETGETPATLTPEHEPVFLRHLFENRIFPEFGVARPNRRAFLSYNRTTVTAQIAAVAAIVILTLGVGISYRRLKRENREVVTPFLQVIVNDRNQMKGVTSKPTAGMDHNEYDLLDGMAMMGDRGFQSWFLPASHWSRLHRDIEAAMVPAFEQLVFKTIHLRLESRAVRLILEPLPAPPENNAVALSITQTPEYRNLQTYSQNLTELQHFINLYNHIRQPNHWVSPKQFESLVVYLGGRPLPQGFDYEHNSNFQSALQHAQGEEFDCGPRESLQATQRVRQMVGQLYSAWYDHNVLLDDAAVIEQQTSALMNREDGSNSAPDLSTLQAAIAQLQGDMNNPGLTEIAQNHFSIGGPLANALSTALTKSCYLNPGLGAVAVQEGQDAFNRLQQNLLQQSTNLTGPIFDSSSGTLQLSAGMQQLQAGIVHMQSLPFMSAPQDASLSGELPDGNRLMWNTGDLQQALSLQKTYSGFVQTALAGTPWRLHDALRRLALRQLQHTILHLLGQAEQFEPVASAPGDVSLQQDIVPGVQNFQAALPDIEKLQSMMRNWGDYGSAAELRSVTRAQAMFLLEMLQQKFSQQAPYVIRDGDFSWWNGTQPAALGAFGADSPDGLAQYLGFQQARIKTFADLARPLVSYLGDTATDMNRSQALQLQRWSSIVQASTEAASQNPNSSLLQLNAFIRTGMDQITPAHGCAAPGGRQRADFDYFLAVRDRLRRQLQERCENLQLGSAWSSYTQLEDYFNQHLAGRFPFVEQGEIDRSADADPAALAQFLQMLGQMGTNARSALQNTHQFGASRLAALQFLRQAMQVRDLFTQFVPAGSVAQAPVFDLAASFRVNRAHEHGGDRIIGWSFQTGGQSATMGGAPATLRWVYGQPVQLNLRWALDSPVIPAAVKASAHLHVAGKSAVIAYRDPWALLRMLRTYQAPPADFTGLTDPHPVTMAVGTPTMTAAGRPGPRTLVFVRVQLMPAGKKTALNLPDFPARAPQLAGTKGGE